MHHQNCATRIRSTLQQGMVADASTITYQRAMRDRIWRRSMLVVLQHQECHQECQSEKHSPLLISRIHFPMCSTYKHGERCNPAAHPVSGFATQDAAKVYRTNSRAVLLLSYSPYPRCHLCSSAGNRQYTIGLDDHRAGAREVTSAAFLLAPFLKGTRCICQTVIK